MKIKVWCILKMYSYHIHNSQTVVMTKKVVLVYTWLSILSSLSWPSGPGESLAARWSWLGTAGLGRMSPWKMTAQVQEWISFFWSKIQQHYCGVNDNRDKTRGWSWEERVGWEKEDVTMMISMTRVILTTELGLIFLHQNLLIPFHN